jgi:RNA polymerase sigma factor (sigma-70 family)
MSWSLSVSQPVGPAINAALLATLSDEQLLARFFRTREDAAFEAIVKRHGPVVYGVCRRILPDSNDVEDAFQATFLVLVRKGATLRQPGRLSSWLYGVANRTARKVRLQAALRSRSERKAGERPLPTDVSEMKYDELRTILDEEIARLPEKYALPLVLCYLEGKTNAQAAEQLGWPEGSMSRRLSRGRELLRSRLLRRGLAMSAALVAAVFAKPAPACVPAGLTVRAVQACQLARQGFRVEDIVSPQAAKAVHDVLLALTATTRTVSASILAAASMLLMVSTAVWQFGSPAYGASTFRFSGDSVHGLVRPAASSPGTLVSTSPAAGGCGAPVVVSSGEPAGATVVAAPAPAPVPAAGH